MRFMLNWLFTSIAIAIATFLVPGIQPFGFAEAWVCFAFVGLFLNIVDSLVKPFLTVISLPLTIITLGIFQLVVNSFMLELASYLSVNLLGVGISIASFGSAFMGSILVSIMRSILDRRRRGLEPFDTNRHTTTKRGRPSQKWAAFLFVKSQRARQSTISTPSPNGRCGLDDVVVAFVGSDKLIERHTVEVVVDEPVQVLPHVERGALVRTRTALAVAVQACDRCQAALGQAQDLAHRVLLGRAREHVAAAFATHAREHVGTYERRQDVLEIFLGNPLSRRDLFERDATGRLVLGQIDHNAQGISALSRNQHV